MSRLPALLLVAALAAGAAGTPPPAPHGAVPSDRQLAWHELETYAFLHFSINTFTDREWGYGDESPAAFTPTDFDADRIVTALKRGGMTAVILTAKHHDGFCLWPTRTTAHSVAASPWRGGSGDVVREIADACRRHGLKFGVYLSPWDRNHPAYGTPAYVDVYRAQLRELLTGYGEIAEVWHDGANGGDGYYGGARETRRIDPRTYYDWPGTWTLVRDLQPGAVIFSDVGPDVRWVGNEKGVAGETNWAPFEPAGPDGGVPAPGHVRTADSPTGHQQGSRWIPAECDVSIRPGWFWHEAENDRVKTAGELFDLYFQSVGRGCSLLLNVPPDRRGRIHEIDAAALEGFHDLVRRTFAVDLTAGAGIVATDIRGKDPAYGPERLIDHDRTTYWAASDGVRTATIGLDLPGPAKFSVIRLREAIQFGQRVEAFAVEAWQDVAWVPIATGTTIGPSRLLRLDRPVIARRVRLRITRAAASPALSEFGLYLEPSSPIRN